MTPGTNTLQSIRGCRAPTGVGAQPSLQGVKHDREDRNKPSNVLTQGRWGAGAIWVSSLQELSVGQAAGHTSGVSPYGVPAPTIDGTTGLKLLQLPDGFRYWSYSWTGDLMSDGVKCPALHDGMGVIDEWHDDDDDDDDDWDDRHTFQGHGDEDDDDHDDDRRRRSGKLILVRNHEPAAGTPYLQNRPDITYASDGAGGTTNLIFDARKGKWLRAWSTLAGTIRNCAGGVTPWGTWITNEETPIVGHGWNFEVGPTVGNPKADCQHGALLARSEHVRPGDRLRV